MMHTVSTRHVKRNNNDAIIMIPYSLFIEKRLGKRCRLAEAITKPRAHC